MKLLTEIADCKRIRITATGHDGGMGVISMPEWQGSVIWSFGGGWEHVSVSPYKKNIIPSWDDMCRLKDIFFKENEAVIEIHPPKSEYVNNVPNCLHLWRPCDGKMPLPPSIMVGMRKGQTAESARREIDDVCDN